jgi:hypothetical protein
MVDPNMVDYFKERIVIKYCLVVEEYFDTITKLNVLNTLSSPDYTLFLGLEIMNLIFGFALLKKKSVDYAYFYSQKSYCYFLEYIEQIYKSDLSQCLNHTDVVLFVYKKTVFEILYNNSDEEPSRISRVENMMSLNEEINDECDSDELNRFFNILSSFTMIFFFRNSSAIQYSDRAYLAKKYLRRLGENIECLPFLESGIKIIQDKFAVDMQTCEELLDKVLEKLSNPHIRMRMIVLSEITNHHFLGRVLDPGLQEKWEGGMSGFVGWFYGIE